MSGVCIISVPKSGTMFLTRSIERIFKTPCIFGINAADQNQVKIQMQGGVSKDIKSVLHSTSPSPDVIARRYAQMLGRNRSCLGGEQKVLISDHGFASFPKFLINPEVSDITPPDQIFENAERNKLQVVFLHRDIRHVAASLTHFLVSGKSFLLRTEGFAVTADIVAHQYAPVLVELTQKWRDCVERKGGICVSYEQLVQDPQAWISRIGQQSGLGDMPQDENQDLMEYKSWTYRSRRTAWDDGFPTEAKQRLEGMNADMAAKAVL